MIHAIAMSRWGPAVGLFIVRIIPTGLAYWLGKVLARNVARNPNAPIVRAIRSNQAVVRGVSYDDPGLDRAVRSVLEMNARSLVDMLKAVARGEKAVRQACVIDEPLRSDLKRWIEQKQAVVIVGPHVVGFDIFLLYLGVNGYPIQALSYYDPQGSYEVQNAIRLKFGFNITPVSVQSLRQAMRHLQQGKAIMTGVDRPVQGGEPLMFFNRPVELPIGHTRLALKTKALLLVGIPYLDDDGIYHAKTGLLINPPDVDNELEGARQLAQKVLTVFEDFIRQNPDRWMMFYPLWPDVIPPSEP
jgi:lauroyl/myristoyl acyltransferase